MNSVVLTGRLVYEPEIRIVSSGKKNLPMRLAVSRNDQARTTDFINCHAWENTAEFIKKYFHKGDGIELRGKMQTTSYEKQDGTKATETYVLVNEVSFVPAKKETATVQEAPTATPTTEPDTPSNLPFEI